MTNIGKTLKRVIVSLLGFPLLIVGIILIPLPLPVPGVLVCLVALYILSTEFNWATKYLLQAKVKLRDIYKKAKERADKIERLGDKK